MGKLIILIFALVINTSAQNITHYSAINVFSQIAVGEAMGIGLSVLPLVAAKANSLYDSHNYSNSWGAVAISAYIFGVSAGVHLIAKAENKEHKLISTLFYSAIGGGVSIVITSIVSKKFTIISNDDLAVNAMLPLLGALIYSLALADWLEQSQTINKYENFKMTNKIMSHKDLVERSQIIKINLFRIAL